MRMIKRLATVAVLAAAIGTAAAAPASAASDPAVTNCSFTPIYTNYQNGQLSGLRFYYPRNTALTVTAGDGEAWFVRVNRNNDTGWMDADCVAFLA